MKNQYYLVTLLICLCQWPALATDIVLNDQITQLKIGRQVELLKDPTHQLTFADVRSPAVARRFRPGPNDLLNQGFTNADYWIRFRVQNASVSGQNEFILDLNFTNFYRTDIYVIDAAGRVSHRAGGDILGRAGREIQYPNHAFYLPVRSGQAEWVYIRLDGKMGQMMFPLRIWSTKAFIDYSQYNSFLWGGYLLLLAFTLIFHAALYINSRRRSYLLLTIYLAVYLLYECTRGYELGPRYFWPDNAFLIVHGNSLFANLAACTFVIFYRHVLDSRRNAPWLHRLLTVLLVGCIGSFFARVFGLLPDEPVPMLNFITPLIGTVLMLVLGAIVMAKGYRPARYYVAASASILVGVILMFLNRLNLIPGTDFYVHYTLNIGSLIEVTFLSLGIAAGLRYEREERKAAKEQAYSQLLRQKEEIEAALLAGQTRERKRVSLDLHNNLGTFMAAINLRLRAMNELTLDQTNQQVYADVQQLIDRAYDEIHLTAQNLMPPELETQGLSAAVQQLADLLDEFKVLSLHVDTKAYRPLAPATELELYSLIRELVTNVMKHAQATDAYLYIGQVGTKNLMVQLRDNGRGITHKSDGSNKPNGMGLRSIRRQVEEQWRGQITIRSVNGTTVELTIPVPLAVPSAEPLSV